MRVIAGSARRINLECPSGKHTRPTTDRIKETLFNMLQTEVYDTRFLDLFSGSGGIGIEALSRGAGECVFVENDREAVSCIKTNLKKTRFTDNSQVMAMDVMQALRRLDSLGRSFDIIFMDPPYRMDWEAKVIPYLLSSSLTEEGTLLIVETALDTDISYMEDFPCEIERVKQYKTNQHVFLRV
ncbi:MAG: 16S rRNA (guanine(966)-N(2))-methyltransferase RsmD [Butyribacter sp.]|nr:16S rRNA (guanine(966)-N(2))-methyltransferase RsmD [Butyribacter sp.]